MRISDWSSDVCSSDLLRSRFTNAPYGHGNVEAGIVMRPGFARQYIFRRFAAMRGRPFLQRGSGMFWRRMLAVNTLGPCCTDEGLGSFHARISEEHTYQLHSLIRISYTVFCCQH